MVVVKYYTTRILAYMLGARYGCWGCAVKSCVCMSMQRRAGNAPRAREEMPIDLVGGGTEPIPFLLLQLINCYRPCIVALPDAWLHATRHTLSGAAACVCVTVCASSQRGVQIKGATRPDAALLSRLRLGRPLDRAARVSSLWHRGTRDRPHGLRKYK